MEVPGIRRVRSRTFRGASEISAQFDPGTDMIVGAAAGAGPHRRDPELAARRTRSEHRPRSRRRPFRSSASTSRAASRRPTSTTTASTSSARRSRASTASAASRCTSSDTREIEVIVDPRKLGASGLTVDDVATALKGQNELTPVGHYPEQRHAAPRARVGTLGFGRPTSATRPSSSRTARRSA